MDTAFALTELIDARVKGYRKDLKFPILCETPLLTPHLQASSALIICNHRYGVRSILQLHGEICNQICNHICHHRYGVRSILHGEISPREGLVLLMEKYPLRLEEFPF